MNKSWDVVTDVHSSHGSIGVLTICLKPGAVFQSVDGRAKTKKCNIQMEETKTITINLSFHENKYGKVTVQPRSKMPAYGKDCVCS